jgi:hypothetical protein
VAAPIERLFERVTDTPTWPDFYQYVTTNLGDVPVVDGSRIISRKIQGYWIIWRYMQIAKAWKTSPDADKFWEIAADLLGEEMENLPRPLVDHYRILRFLRVWKMLGGTTE